MRLCCDLLNLFFFFKQKTAYEMRISDWSSDVCSSDLLPSPAPAPLIKADAASYRHAPRVASEATRPAQREATELVRHLVPQRFDSARPSGWAVQLGAYDSLAIAKEKWGVLKKRNDVLAAFPASSHAATVNGHTFYRLTANGLKSRADAMKLCGDRKAAGQPCFVRERGGGESGEASGQVRGGQQGCNRGVD